MLGFMGAKRVIIYMPDELLSALNRVTERSPQSRSEIICDAVQCYLSESRSSLTPTAGDVDAAFFDRMPDQPRPKSKLWIN